VRLHCTEISRLVTQVLQTLSGRAASGALRNANLPVPMRQVKDTEELFVSSADVVLEATEDTPLVTGNLEATFALQDI